jgi:hypothetical protein
MPEGARARHGVTPRPRVASLKSSLKVCLALVALIVPGIRSSKCTQANGEVPLTKELYALAENGKTSLLDNVTCIPSFAFADRYDNVELKGLPKYVCRAVC